MGARHEDGTAGSQGRGAKPVSPQMPLDFSAKAIAARDEGIERAADHAGETWMAKAVLDFATFLKAQPEREATAERWRYDWLARHNPPPESHKAWGAVAMVAARRGLAENTGRYVKAVSPKTHAHRVPIWRAAA